MFGARTDLAARVFPLFSGLEANTCVFQEVYVCVIFFYYAALFNGT